MNEQKLINDEIISRPFVKEDFVTKDGKLTGIGMITFILLFECVTKNFVEFINQQEVKNNE